MDTRKLLSSTRRLVRARQVALLCLVISDEILNRLSNLLEPQVFQSVRIQLARVKCIP